MSNRGTFLCSREAARVMRGKGKGKIITISSLQGFAGRSGDPAYAASKAAGNRDDLFGIVIFLASEASDFVSGAIRRRRSKSSPFRISRRAWCPG